VAPAEACLVSHYGRSGSWQLWHIALQSTWLSSDASHRMRCSTVWYECNSCIRCNLPAVSPYAMLLQNLRAMVACFAHAMVYVTG
jgi:hypothetical protein